MLGSRQERSVCRRPHAEEVKMRRNEVIMILLCLASLSSFFISLHKIQNAQSSLFSLYFIFIHSLSCLFSLSFFSLSKIHKCLVFSHLHSLYFFSFTLSCLFSLFLLSFFPFIEVTNIFSPLSLSLSLSFTHSFLFIFPFLSLLFLFSLSLSNKNIQSFILPLFYLSFSALPLTLIPLFNIPSSYPPLPLNTSIPSSLPLHLKCSISL